MGQDTKLKIKGKNPISMASTQCAKCGAILDTINEIDEHICEDEKN